MHDSVDWLDLYMLLQQQTAPSAKRHIYEYQKNSRGKFLEEKYQRAVNKHLMALFIYFFDNVFFSAKDCVHNHMVSHTHKKHPFTLHLWGYSHIHTRHVYWKYPVKLSIFTLNVTMLFFLCCSFFLDKLCLFVPVSTNKSLRHIFKPNPVLKSWIYNILAVRIVIIYLQRTKYWLYSCCSGVSHGLFLLMSRQMINKLSLATSDGLSCCYSEVIFSLAVALIPVCAEVFFFWKIEERAWEREREREKAALWI